jgi:hypothetical protein
MARTKALSIMQDASTKADLSEIYGLVIENVQKSTLAMGLKSQLYTGDPKTGSAEFKRFTNSTAKTYGTARTAGKGDAITAPPTVVNLDQKKEIVEEAANFDLDTFGVASIMARRVANHVETMINDLDTAFFAAAGTAATAVTTTATTPAEQIEELIQTLEQVSNSYVRGVPRNMINVICDPALYGKIRTALDSLPASNVDTAAEEFGTYHGVRVYSHINLPKGVHAIAMADGAIAQPVVTYPYTEPERIPLSNDSAVALFYNYGTKALSPDLIFKIEDTKDTE